MESCSALICTVAHSRSVGYRYPAKLRKICELLHITGNFVVQTSMSAGDSAEPDQFIGQNTGEIIDSELSNGSSYAAPV
jgi:hypothetical protein